MIEIRAVCVIRWRFMNFEWEIIIWSEFLLIFLGFFVDF